MATAASPAPASAELAAAPAPALTHIDRTTAAIATWAAAAAATAAPLPPSLLAALAALPPDVATAVATAGDAGHLISDVPQAVRLAARLHGLAETGAWQLAASMATVGFSEVAEHRAALQAAVPATLPLVRVLLSLTAAADFAPSKASDALVGGIVSAMGGTDKAVITALGYRVTTGTQPLLPPLRTALMASAAEMHAARKPTPAPSSASASATSASATVASSAAGGAGAGAGADAGSGSASVSDADSGDDDDGDDGGGGVAAVATERRTTPEPAPAPVPSGDLVVDPLASYFAQLFGDDSIRATALLPRSAVAAGAGGGVAAGAGAGAAAATSSAPRPTSTATGDAGAGAGGAPRPPRVKKAKVPTLTVGGRALAKHCHRGVESWWGMAAGSDADKNAHADVVLRRVVDGAVWVNVHSLPGAEPVIEVRVAEGYGARWTADGAFLRGFLEPPMLNGHAVGWRH